MKRQIISLLLAFVCFFTISCKAKSNANSIDENYIASNENREAKQTLFKVIENIDKLESFYTVTTGESKSLGITQKISASRYVVGQTVFKQSVSYSGFVKTAIQTCVIDGKYFVRQSKKIRSLNKVEWQNFATDVGELTFLNQFGDVCYQLNNYVLTEQTVIAVIKEEFQDGYLLKVSADSTLSTVNIVKEMKTNSNSENLPIFESVYMEIFVDGQLNVKKITYKGKYKVKIAILGELDCQENVEEVFYGFNQTTTFPEKEFFTNCVVSQ